MSGLRIATDFVSEMREMEKRVARLERHRHPDVLDPVSENEVGAVGVHHCPETGETVIQVVGPDGVGTSLSCGCITPVP